MDRTAPIIGRFRGRGFHYERNSEFCFLPYETQGLNYKKRRSSYEAPVTTGTRIEVENRNLLPMALIIVFGIFASTMPQTSGARPVTAAVPLEERDECDS